MVLQTVKIRGQLGHQILKIDVFPFESSDLLASGIASCVPTQTLLACLHEFLDPRVEVVRLVAFTTTQFIDCDLTTETFEDYVDLLFCGVFPASGWSGLPNEPSGVLAPFFSRVILVLDVRDHLSSLPEA